MLVEADTLFRVYSMTKPITSVAAMMPWEEAPSSSRTRSHASSPPSRTPACGPAGRQTQPETAAPREPVRMWHLLTHTSGLAYGFAWAIRSTASTATAGSSSARRRGWISRAASTSGRAAAAVRTRRGAQLLASPPTSSGAWSRSSAAAARLVFLERDLGALGMTDTAFGNADPQRLAALYAPGLVRNDRLGVAALGEPRFLSGGGGLIKHRRRLPPFHADAARRRRVGRRRACSGRVRCATWAATTCPGAPS